MDPMRGSKRRKDKELYDVEEDLYRQQKEKIKSRKKNKYSLLQENPKYRSYRSKDDPYCHSEVISPSTRLMMQSERQFIEEYGRGKGNMRGGTQPQEEETVWERFSRMFTFGCIETNHNRR